MKLLSLQFSLISLTLISSAESLPITQISRDLPIQSKIPMIHLILTIAEVWIPKSIERSHPRVSSRFHWKRRLKPKKQMIHTVILVLTSPKSFSLAAGFFAVTSSGYSEKSHITPDVICLNENLSLEINQSNLFTAPGELQVIKM